MEKNYNFQESESGAEEKDILSRREYLISLKKWSKVVVGGVLLGGLLASTNEEAEARGSWANRRGGRRRGGSWANRRGPGGSWANRR